MTDLGWKPDYDWLERFWDVVVADRPDRIWRMFALSHIFACDGSALLLLHDRLRDRGGRVEWRYVQGGTPEPAVTVEEMKGRDVLLLGRSRAFLSSRVIQYAHRAFTNHQVQFIDGADGRRGRSIRCGDRMLNAHELKVPPHAGRCDVDYALLSYCQADVDFERRQLVEVGGLSSFGTWALTRVLTDDARRKRLVEEVRAIAPWKAGMRPEEGFEICIRVKVNSEGDLPNLLNDERFDVRVEAVAIRGDELRLRDDAIPIVLRPAKVGDGGIVVVGPIEFHLGDLRFRIPRLLVERGAPIKIHPLCVALGLLQGGEPRAKVRVVRQRVVKAIFDLNRSFRIHVPDLRDSHPVTAGPDGYQLVRLRGIVEKAV